MLKNFIFLIVLFLPLKSSYSQTAKKNPAGTMQVGVARVDITPSDPIRLTGYAARGKQEATQVLSRLSAKALAFGSTPKQTSLLITVDLVGINWRVTSQVVEKLSKKTGLDPAQIAVCASHTHGSPEVGNLINILQCRGDYPANFYFNESLMDLDELVHIAQFSEQLVDKLVEVSMAALNNRKPSL
ncbi:MAG TPA: neutral/alkaline non-lysosomal ceramidase N-terminal domain-containing protein, partial [Sphingobacteriaceae bacterium]